VFPIAFQ